MARYRAEIRQCLSEKHGGHYASCVCDLIGKTVTLEKGSEPVFDQVSTYFVVGYNKVVCHDEVTLFNDQVA